MLSPYLVIQRSMRATPLGFCLRVIVNETYINLEKTTSIVPSVILINLWLQATWTEICDFPLQISVQKQ